MMQQSSRRAGGDGRQVGGHQAEARGATEKLRWCREKKDVGIWVTWRRRGSHVRPNYRTSVARSEGAASQ